MAYIDNIHLGEAAPQQATAQQTGTPKGDGTVLVTNSQRNGEVLLADGTPFNAGFRHKSGTPLKVKGVGEQGFVCTAIIVHHGPGRTMQTTFEQKDFLPDGSLVIPGNLFTDEVVIEGVMTEKK